MNIATSDQPISMSGFKYQLPPTSDNLVGFTDTDIDNGEITHPYFTLLIITVFLQCIKWIWNILALDVQLFFCDWGLDMKETVN